MCVFKLFWYNETIILNKVRRRNSIIATSTVLVIEVLFCYRRAFRYSEFLGQILCFLLLGIDQTNWILRKKLSTNILNHMTTGIREVNLKILPFHWPISFSPVMKVMNAYYLILKVDHFLMFLSWFLFYLKSGFTI